MERNLRLNEDVLRHMTIKVDELEEGDSVMLQSRSSRPDRRRDRDDDNDDDDRNTSDKDDETADDSTEKEDA